MAKTITPKAAREAKKLTQMDLAIAAGISIAAIQRAERNERWSAWPSIANAHKKALGICP